MKRIPEITIEDVYCATRQSHRFSSSGPVRRVAIDDGPFYTDARMATFVIRVTEIDKIWFYLLLEHPQASG
jgi:hypothetical protein